MKIYAQKNGTLTQGEMQEIASLLIKAGYTVRLSTAKVSESKRVKAVEFTGDGKEDGNG